MAIAQSPGVKNSFLSDEELPADNLVPGPGIALDSNPVDIDKVPLVYIYDDINQLFFLLGIDCWSSLSKSVAVFSIVVV